MPATSSPTTVVLVTTAFPLDAVGEVTFVRPELERLVEHFDRVVIAPAAAGRVQHRMPGAGAELDLGLSQQLHPANRSERIHWLAGSIASPWLLQELRRCPALLLHPAALKRFAYCVAAALRTGDWLVSRVRAGGWDPASTVAYSYWLNHLAAGLGRGRDRLPSLTVVARAHGADIYQDRYVPGCFPLHPQAIAAVDRVFVASEAGQRHLADHYPAAGAKLEVAPLGSREPGFGASPSSDGTFRMVSCSSLEELKRVELLVAALAALGRRLPGRNLEWRHLGDGACRPRIEGRCRELLPANVTWSLAGRLVPDEVMAHYRDRPVDLFISTTASEGGRPVSMAEALSCGIPVVATAVGGVPEIIAGDHGWLVSADPTAEEVADCLAPLVERSDLTAHRRAARAYWEEHLRADELAERFVQRLTTLIPSGAAPG
jgi:glycosyltransferase involved in cell wall biosynthesis